MVVVGETDRRVDDGRAKFARLFDGRDRVRQHVGLVHDRLHRLVQRAALGGEIVLIFDENHRSRFRIHRLSPSDFALSTARVKRRRYIWTNSAPKTSASLSRPPLRDQSRPTYANQRPSLLTV